MPSSNILVPVFGSLFSSVVPADRAFDADTLAWEAQVIVNGGTVSLARRIIVDQFIFDLKSAGAWALTDDYWGFWAENAAQALTSLKQRRLATAVNAPTFTADRGYDFDGATQYINTGFVPSTHGVAMTGTDLHFGVYERSNVSSNSFHGTWVSATRSLILNPRTLSNNISGQANAELITSGGLFTDSRGLTGVHKKDATIGIVKNGSVVQTATPTVGTTLSNREMYLACYNNGSPSGFRGAALGCAITGASLSDAQQLAQYNAVQAFATAVGAQV